MDERSDRVHLHGFHSSLVRQGRRHLANIDEDPGEMGRIYDLADQPFTGNVEAKMAAYMSDHPRGRHGRIDYRAEDVGLERSELERRFGFYADRFLSD